MWVSQTCRHAVHDERKVSSERADRMKAELDSLNVRLEEERRRSAELLLQVTRPAQRKPTAVFNRANNLSCLEAQRPAEVSAAPKRRAEEDCSSGAAGD